MPFPSRQIVLVLVLVVVLGLASNSSLVGLCSSILKKLSACNFLSLGSFTVAGSPDSRRKKYFQITREYPHKGAKWRNMPPIFGAICEPGFRNLPKSRNSPIAPPASSP
jgi:hypothetical protein